MKVVVKPMRETGARPRAGGHNSSAMKFDAVWHKHDLHQFLYAFEGSIQVESEASQFFVPPELAAFIPAGLVHCTRIEGRRSGSVFLPASAIKRAGARIRILRVSPLMREMIQEALRWPIDRAEEPQGRTFFKTFAMLSREWIEDEAALHLPMTDDPRLKKAMDYTRAHLSSACSVDVCRAAGLSERSLRRRFLALTGMGWAEYRHRSRLIQAATLLEKSRASITEIAASVGFASVSAFSQAFRVFAGETPKRYRNRVCLK